MNIDLLCVTSIATTIEHILQYLYLIMAAIIEYCLRSWSI